jgi:outer membrane protein OmpA-like peptidoglycan-associated protein
VAGYLMNNFSIGRRQPLLFGYGAANPVASSANEEGQALNRCVEIAVGGM